MFNPLRLYLMLPVFLAATLPAGGELPPAENEFQGVVTEVMTSGGYVYLNVANESGAIWVATRECEAVVGDEVRVPSSWEMRNFRSKTLDRTFATILFAPRVFGADEVPEPTQADPHPDGCSNPPNQPKGTAKRMPPVEAHHGTGGPALVVAPGYITAVRGGLTINDCFASRETLGGKGVKVRGIVVKYSPNILGTNWIHLKDGTGGPGTDDLVVTSGETVRVGDIIVIEGVIEYDKNIGSGYTFPAIIEDGTVRVEGKYVPPPTEIRT